MQLLTKMSVKSVGANPARAKTENCKVPLARFYGIARGIVMKVDQRGEPITGLTGDFYATNVESGEEFQSGVLYLPGGIHELLVNGVDQGEMNDKGKPIYTPVEFGFDVWAAPATNPIGYSYEATPLLEARVSDPIAALQEKFGDLPKALPAPKPEKAKDEPAE